MSIQQHPNQLSSLIATHKLWALDKGIIKLQAEGIAAVVFEYGQ